MQPAPRARAEARTSGPRRPRSARAGDRGASCRATRNDHHGTRVLFFAHLACGRRGALALSTQKGALMARMIVPTNRFRFHIRSRHGLGAYYLKNATTL